MTILPRVGSRGETLWRSMKVMSIISLFCLLQKQPRFFKLSILFFKNNVFTILGGSNLFFEQMRIFEETLFVFFQEGLFVRRTDRFSGKVYCSSNRHEFFRRVYRTDMFFSRTSIHRTDLIILSNGYKIFQKPFFSPRTLFFHRTDIHFPGSPI